MFRPVGHDAGAGRPGGEGAFTVFQTVAGDGGLTAVAGQTLGLQDWADVRAEGNVFAAGGQRFARQRRPVGGSGFRFWGGGSQLARWQQPDGEQSTSGEGAGDMHAITVVTADVLVNDGRASWIAP